LETKKPKAKKGKKALATKKKTKKPSKIATADGESEDT
jgi:hypothetical protein